MVWIYIVRVTERVELGSIHRRTFLKGLVIIAGATLANPDQVLAAVLSDDTAASNAPVTPKIGQLLYGQWERYCPDVDQVLRGLLHPSRQGASFEVVNPNYPTRELSWKDARADYCLSMILHQRPNAKPILTTWAAAWIDNEKALERRSLPEFTTDFATPVTVPGFKTGLARMLDWLDTNANRLNHPDIRISPLTPPSLSYKR